MSEDFDLLTQWRDGDKAAGNRLVRRHFSSVYRFFRSKLDDKVEDLTQQTFLAMAEGRERFRGDGSFKAYLFGIARRQLMLTFRSRYRAGKVFAPAEHSVQDLVPGLDPSPSHLAANAQTQRVLLAALRTIPLDFQMVVELHYWEGMSVTEIAEAMGTAPGTVKSRLHRARNLLQERIDQAAEGSLVVTNSDDLGRWVQSMQGHLGPPGDPDGDPPGNG